MQELDKLIIKFERGSFLVLTSAEILDTLRLVRARLNELQTALDAIATAAGQTGGLNTTDTPTFGLTTIIPAANADGVDISGISLTGSAANSGLSVTGTWNTSGAPIGLLVNMTNTASGAAARLLNLETGGSSQFSITPDGQLNMPGAAVTETSILNISATDTSTNTALIAGLSLSPSFNPGGASLTTLAGLNILPTITGSSIAITTFSGIVSQVKTSAGYTGTVGAGYDFIGSNPVIAGANPFTAFTGYRQNTVTNGNGITTGTVTNKGIDINSFTAVPANGGTMINTGILIAMPSGVNAGVMTACGLCITGNGPTVTANGLTVWAINSTSTAVSQITGGLNSTPIGAGTASTGAFTTLTSSGATTMTAGTASSSTATGTLVVTGGLGLSGALWVGGLENVAGVLTGSGTTASTSGATGEIVSAGGIGAAGAIWAGTFLAVSGTTLPAQAAGTLGIGGEVAAPTTSSNGEADIYITSTTGGLTLQAKGSTSDITLANSAGAAACTVPTGGTTLSCGALTVTGSTSPTNGIYLPAAGTTGMIAATALEFFIGASLKGDFAQTTAATWTFGAATTINSATFKVTTLAASTAVDTVCYSTVTGLFTEEPTGTTCTVSDERKKLALRPISNRHSLDIIVASTPSSFYYTNDIDPSGDFHLGFGAQTMARIAPELVQYGDDGVPNAVKQIELLPVTWAAIKQISANDNMRDSEIRKLKADNDNLRAELADVKMQLGMR